MRAKRRRWAAVLLLAVLLAGCWDRREIEERSNVLAVGVDVCAQGPNCNLVITREIAIPGRIPLGASADGGGGGSKGESSVVDIVTPGRDVSESVQRAQAELNRTMHMGHTRVMVFSEEFARRGMADFLDYERRLPEVRRMMWIAVSDGPAEAVIKARPSLERVPALFLNDMLDDGVKFGRVPEVFLGEFMTRITNKGEDTVAPIIRLVERDHPALAGMAVFRGSRMVRRLTPDEMVTYMELRGMRKGSELLHVPLPNDQFANLRVTGRSTKYRVRWVQGRVKTDVDMSLETDLVQLSADARSDDPATIRLIEEQADEQVLQRSLDLLKKLQSDGADILGVGERVRAYLPGAWAGVRDWSEAFRQAGFEVGVRVNIRQTGMEKD